MVSSGGDHELQSENISYNWTQGNSTEVLGTDIKYEFTPTAENDGEIYYCTVLVEPSSFRAKSEDRMIRVLGIIMLLLYC